MSTYNICFHGEIRKTLLLLGQKKPFSGAMNENSKNTSTKPGKSRKADVFLEN